MASLKRFLLDDLGTKVLALILALVVYVHVLSGQDRELTYRIPLRLATLPSTLSVANDLPEQVRVKIRASGKDLVKLRTRQFHAEVRLEAAHAGRLQRPIMGSDVMLPMGVEVREVTILEPAVLEIVLEETERGRLPVAVAMRGELSAGLAIVSPPRLQPDRVSVSGPASRIALVDSVRTAPLDLNALRETGEWELSLVPPQGLTLEQEKVGVRIEIGERVTRQVGPLPVSLESVQPTRVLWIHPDEASIEISGLRRWVDAVPLDQVRVVASIGSRPGAHAQRAGLRAVLPKLPRDVRLSVTCRPESVTVRIR